MYNVKCIVQMTRELPCDSFLNFLEISMNKNISILVVCGALAMSAHAADQDATMKADVLGRHVTSTRNIPKAYIKDVKKSVNQKSDMVKTKSLAKVANYPSEAGIAKTYGIFEHRNGKRWYALNGRSDLSESQYLSEINQIEEDDKGRESYYRSYSREFTTKDPSTYYFVSFEGTDGCVGKTSCSVPISYGQDVHGNALKAVIHEFLDYKKILKNSNLYNTLYNNGYKGNNIGISFSENGAPLAGIVPTSKLVMKGDCGTAYGSVPHATNVARVLNRIAPKAMLYGYMNNCKNEWSNSVVVPPDGFNPFSPKVFIGSHSYGDPHIEYALESRDIDDYIYETRTIQFGSIGNSGLKNPLIGHASPVAMGMNVISVGAVRNDMMYYPSSSWKNPKLRENSSVDLSGKEYAKPEIANFADILFPEDSAVSVYVNNNSSGSLISPRFGATSSATPYTAAATALLLDRYPFYRWHPEVVKALLITSSVKKINDAELHDTDNVQYNVAMGVPDGKAMTQNNRSRFWNGNNEEFFNSNRQISFTESNIEPNKKYRVAIAWLSSGTYVYNSGRIPQDIDLEVYQNGVRVGYSNSYANPFEFVEFTSNSDRPVTITISRFRNDGGRVLLGYNFLRVPDEYQN